MEENNYVKTRDELKKYFETGDRPTETQFAKLLDSYAHLNEFNFGLSIKPSGETFSKYYHFYKAIDLNNPVGYKTVEVAEEPESIEAKLSSEPVAEKAEEASVEEIEGYRHVLSRRVFYKKMNVELTGVDIEEHMPQIIIERYKQSKKLRSGLVKSNGYYPANAPDAEKLLRKSEYDVDNHKMVIDLEPIRYFSPAEDYRNFVPSGSIRRNGSFKMTKYFKSYALARAVLTINISGVAYRSQPVNFRILLGSSDEVDPINFIFD